MVIEVNIEGNINTDLPAKQKTQSNENEADFEKAIHETGYGIFNYKLLLFVGLPSCMASVFETTYISYVLPNAECDLKLTLADKGVLNAITYAGMIASAIFWGYLADTEGRRKILIYGYAFDFICVIGCAFSQNVWILMIFKFLGGFVICGPFAVLMSYLSEFHGTNHRPRVMMYIGMFFSLSTILLSLSAWFILSKNWTIVFKEYFELKSWQIFIIICAIPSFVGTIAVSFFPESPKFLMTQGRNAEALEIFRNIFKKNTGKPLNEYPVKFLIDKLAVNKSNANTSNHVSFRDGLAQITPMFRKPYVGYSLLIYTIQFCSLLGLNTIRLWLPQLFAIISEFENSSHISDYYKIDVNLCKMLEFSVNKSKYQFESDVYLIEECTVNVSDDMYINTIIVGLTTLMGYFIAGAVINACGNKNILIYGLLIPGTCGIGLYWSKNSITTVILSALFVSVGSISSTALIGVAVNLFPTSLRTMIISLVMMFGRLGALIGNVVFPYLIALGCFPPFLMVGVIMLVSSCLCILLPQTNKKPLQ